MTDLTLSARAHASAGDDGRGIVFDDVSRHHQRGATNVVALDRVSLRVAGGALTAVVGPSGSGKSTLLQLAGALDAPTSGRVVVGGQDLGALDEKAIARFRHRTVGFVFQFFNLLPAMTAWENVAVPALLGGARLRTSRQRALELLDRVGLADRAGHRPGELSGGQLQRVAIARALFNDPAIVLADEPTGNLDSSSAREVLDLLVSLSADEGRTVLVVTHDDAVAHAAQTQITLLDGRIAR